MKPTPKAFASRLAPFRRNLSLFATHPVGLILFSLDVIAIVRHQPCCCCIVSHSLPACRQGQHLQQHSRPDHGGLAPWSGAHDPVAFTLDVVVSSRARKFFRRPTRRAARLCHSLSRERVHVSELQIRVADAAECQYLRGAGHDASDSLSIPTEWLSPCAARVSC